MLIIDHENKFDHVKANNIHEFLLNSIRKYAYFTVKTLVSDYLNYLEKVGGVGMVEITRNNSYQKNACIISRGLRTLKANDLIVKYNSRAYKVNKEKLKENDLSIHEENNKNNNFDVMKFAKELRKNGLKVKIKYPSD